MGDFPTFSRWLLRTRNDSLERVGRLFNLRFGDVNMGREADAKGGAEVHADLGGLEGVNHFGRLRKANTDRSAATGWIGRCQERPAVFLGQLYQTAG